MNQDLLNELNKESKSAMLKRNLFAFLISNGTSTLTDIAKDLGLSIPTVTKLVTEFIKADAVKDYGKLETSGGRYPQLYGLQPNAAYFVGVDVKHEYVNIGIINFVGEMCYTAYEVPFNLRDTPEALDELCKLVSSHITASGYRLRDILNINFNIPGRINPMEGTSHNYFCFSSDSTLAELLSEKLGTNVSLDNDTRGMTYGEYTQGVCAKSSPRNVLYINLSWGIGLGIILDHKIFLGKSGFSGEIGHITAFDNQLICHCGKKGCFETEVSGIALHRMILERIQAGESSKLSAGVLRGEPLTLAQIVQAALAEDVLVLELLGELGHKLGKQIAGLINVINPEMVVIGGSLSQTGDYLLQAIKTVVSTYSLNLVNKDTEIVTAVLGDKAGLIGACMQARIRRFSANSVSLDY